MTAAQRRSIGFFAGIGYLRRGARFVYVEHRALARLWLWPLIFTFVALAGGTWFALDEYARVADAIWSTPAASGFMSALHHAFEWLIGLVLIAAALIFSALLGNVIAAPFNDALSEAIERIELGQSASSFSLARVLRDLGRTLGLELLKLGLYLTVMAALFVLGLLLPGVGPVIQMLVAPCLTAIFLAIDYMDFAAARRDLTPRQRLRFAFARLRPVLGLGLGIELLLFVPFLNLFFMPAAVAGGTLMFLDLNRNRNGPN